MRNAPSKSAALAVLLAIAILCGLGTWQVQRLHWKTDLLAKLDAAYSNPHPPLLEANAVAHIPTGRNDFTAARLTGAFLPGRELQIGIRIWNGAPGYHAVAPFKLTDGAIVLVDRGWVPAEKKLPAQRPDSTPAPGTITITGLFHAPERPNIFIPANQPDKGLWYRWDIAGMLHALNTDFAYPGQDAVPSVVFYELSEPGAAGNLPIRAALHWTLPNDHLYYACFWFTMAGIVALMFGAAVVRRPK